MAAEGSVGSKTELLNVLGDVKARIQDKLGIVDFPMPQFILIGKQSVGKSRVTEALAGETFNFISGTLGSRRPTVLEFRHAPTEAVSKWYVRDRKTNQWRPHAVSEVMKLVGDAHQELGETVSAEPICVRVESAGCVDMQIVDLPGFRDFALDSSKQTLADKIEELVLTFMKDPKNVMLCVEQCGDAATMSTLRRCQALDPKFTRTILIRTKLDKYKNDLTPENVNAWLGGMGDLPETLVRFCMTLPWWSGEGGTSPEPLGNMTKTFAAEDVKMMKQKGLDTKYLPTVGFLNFAAYADKKIEIMFTEAVRPVMENLHQLKESTLKEIQGLSAEFSATDPAEITSTVRHCGNSFAGALCHVMEGIPGLNKNRMTLSEELYAFHDHHRKIGNLDFELLPSGDFSGLNEYVEYLSEEALKGNANAEINGGAQFRRAVSEVEIFLRFCEVFVEIKKQDVIQARGVCMGSLTWRDVLVKLLGHDGQLQMFRRIAYCGQRIKWLFEIQKDVVLCFMSTLEGSAAAARYSGLYIKHAKLINQNEMIKHLIYQTYDKVCERQFLLYLERFNSILTSTFANPWVFLKGTTTGLQMSQDELDAESAKRDRIPREIESRCSIEAGLSKMVASIPTSEMQLDEAVDMVQSLVLKTYGCIRAQVCDQVEIFLDSFFKVPLLRRLEEVMNTIELSEQDKANYKIRRERLESDQAAVQASLKEIQWCTDRLNNFVQKVRLNV